MDDTLSWGMRLGWGRRRQTQTGTTTTTRFGGDGGDEPVLIAVISAPVEAEMAKDALAEAGVPAYVKQNSLGQVYGLSIGAFGTAEVWTPPAVAEQARDVLIGIGVLQPDNEHPE